jgi:hypothetical protein
MQLSRWTTGEGRDYRDVVPAFDKALRNLQTCLAGNNRFRGKNSAYDQGVHSKHLTGNA